MTSKPQPLLTREAILAADDRSTEDIAVPEWGGTVRIRTLSGTDRERYITRMYRLKPNDVGGVVVDQVNIEGANVRLVALSIVDADGEPMFSESDVVALGQKSAPALDRVFQAATRLSRLSASIEQVTADLKAGQNDSSGSGSPESLAIVR